MPTSKICHILRRFVVPKSYANHVFALFGLEVSCIVKVSLRPGRSGPYSATVFFSFAYRFNFALCSNPPARTTTFAVCLLACCVTCLDFGHTPRPPSIMGSATKTQRGEGDCPQQPPSRGCLVKIFALLFTYSAWRDIHPNPED